MSQDNDAAKNAVIRLWDTHVEKMCGELDHLRWQHNVPLADLVALVNDYASWELADAFQEYMEEEF